MSQPIIQRRTLLTAACSAPLLQACIYDSGIRNWSEDVRLPSGEQFIVKRKIIGNANYAGIGDAGAWIYKATEIHFPPDIPKAPQMWSGKYKPLVLGRYADGAFYMVATVQTMGDYWELYWEVEPLPMVYVQFNWTGNQWQLQKALDLNLLGIKTNMLVGSPGKDGQRHWTLADKDTRVRESAMAMYEREIGGEDPNPPRPNENWRKNQIKNQLEQKAKGEKS